jgi:hypothetical protein
MSRPPGSSIPSRPWVQSWEGIDRGRAGVGSIASAREQSNSRTDSPYRHLDQLEEPSLIDLSSRPSSITSTPPGFRIVRTRELLLQPSLLDLQIDAEQLTPEIPAQPNVHQYRCDDCQRVSPDVRLCNVCNCLFCDNCWQAQLVHRRQVAGRGSTIPHEKTAPRLAEKVSGALDPPGDDREREKLYEEDELTAWFGKIRYSNS